MPPTLQIWRESGGTDPAKVSGKLFPSTGVGENAGVVKLHGLPVVINFDDHAIEENLCPASLRKAWPTSRAKSSRVTTGKVTNGSWTPGSASTAYCNALLAEFSGRLADPPRIFPRVESRFKKCRLAAIERAPAGKSDCPRTPPELPPHCLRN